MVRMSGASSAAEKSVMRLSQKTRRKVATVNAKETKPIIDEAREMGARIDVVDRWTPILRAAG